MKTTTVHINSIIIVFVLTAIAGGLLYLMLQHAGPCFPTEIVGLLAGTIGALTYALRIFAQQQNGKGPHH